MSQRCFTQTPSERLETTVRVTVQPQSRTAGRGPPVPCLCGLMWSSVKQNAFVEGKRAMFWKRGFGVMMAIAVLSLLPAAALATSSNGNTQHFGPFPLETTDGGSCGGYWADLTIERQYTVRDNGDGTFTVMARSDGSFVTVGGDSPGACEGSGSRHGSTVQAGVAGTMQGNWAFIVASSEYNPAACDAADADCAGGYGAFVTTVFGPGATPCNATGVCKWSFEYASGAKGLQFHAWKDASTPDGQTEIFTGDIANE